ncbi:hypothetical protein AAVH_22401 [Aphelenchoides avenae]|nr:hypothetical protein AAVH_22401 [Aphelenchus avenae]
MLLYLSILLALANLDVAAGCPAGSVVGEDPRECYVVQRLGEVNWTVAEDICSINYDGHLLFARSPAALAQMFEVGDFWIGAHSSTAKFLDGSSSEALERVQSVPRDGMDCVALNITHGVGVLYAAHCSEKKNFLCSISKQLPPALAPRSVGAPKCARLLQPWCATDDGCYWTYNDVTGLCYSVQYP